MTYPTGSAPFSVTVADINSDNKGDIIVANSGSNSISVLLNTGNGTFTAQATYSTDSGPYSVAAADVNNDNKTDIIVANYGANNFGILLNTGNGTFTAQTNYSTGSSPYCVAVADVNNDNKSDIIVTNYGANDVGVFLSLGETGNFAGLPNGFCIYEPAFHVLEIFRRVPVDYFIRSDFVGFFFLFLSIFSLITDVKLD
jgi:hypothetical protein